jgi:hypothetical protein
MNMLDPHAVLVELNTAGTSNTAVHDAAIAIRDALERFAVMDARKLAGDLVRETETNMGPALKRLEGLAVAAKDAAAGVTAAPPAALRPGQSVGDVATDSPRAWLKTNGFGDDYLNAKEVPNDWAGFLAQAGIQ